MSLGRSPAGGQEEPDSRHGGRRRWIRWLVGIAAGLVVLVGASVVLFVVLTRNPSPGAFYTPPDDLSAPPGTVLRSESFDSGLPAGARGWRVLYVSADEHDHPIAVSGLIIARDDPTEGSHPVLAWAHRTTGIARACAPSLTDEPLEGIPDMSGPLEQGWVVALTDYPGLGTPSPHPYLVGVSEGRAVLDSVRAAHDLDIGMDLSDEYVVWGHSQGGHAAIFAGQLADEYMPDYELAGVAALAPATRLQHNLAAIEGTEAGNLLTILTVEAWSRYYAEITTDILTSAARRPAERIARACLNQPSRYRIVIVGLTLPDTITARDVTADAGWTDRLAQNTPDPGGVTAPLFVGQGLVDDVVNPAVTQAWVSERCAVGVPTEWHTYPGVTHLAIIGPGGDGALAWTIDRFDGVTSPDRCPAT
ncbi:MAG: lipase family protein [Acidimicrobiales bacterium]